MALPILTSEVEVQQGITFDACRRVECFASECDNFVMFASEHGKLRSDKPRRFEEESVEVEVY